MAVQQALTILHSAVVVTMTDLEKLEKLFELANVAPMLYNELGTLKWAGADDGWNLAIDKVQARILELIDEAGFDHDLRLKTET